MTYVTVVQSARDPAKLVILALVMRGGMPTVEQHEVPDDVDSLDALIESLYGDRPPVPLGLEGCKRCGCCGRLIVGFDSPDLARVN